MNAGRISILWLAVFFVSPLYPAEDIETLREFTEFSAQWHKDILLNTAEHDYSEKTGTLICYSGSGKLYANGEAVQKDGDFILHGKWRRYHENGRILAELMYKDGRRNGEASGFYKNGTRAIVCTYDMGKLTGKRLRYDRYGRLLDEADYEDGKQTSLKIIRMLSPSFQKPESIPLASQYDSGQDLWIFRDRDACMIRLYSTTGKLYAEITAVNICTDNEYYSGAAFYYYENGILMERGNFTAGKRDGTWMKYSPEGVLEETRRYISDRETERIRHTIRP